MVRVGIPRALAYYQFFPMWRTFFEKLGAEVVTTPTTTQKMLADGSKRVVADTCLSVKVYLGHVLALAGKCDFIFIPVIRSVKAKEYNCAKFLGLPDMTKAVIPEVEPILRMDFDINKGTDKLLDGIYGIGKNFTADKKKIKQAAEAALKAHYEYITLMSRRGLTPLQALDKPVNSGKEDVTEVVANPAATIAVVGHHYLLYDGLVNHRLMHRLEEANCKVVTPEMLTAAQMEAGTNKLVGKSYWTWEEEVIGAGNHYLENNVDGVIGVAAFGCGPDSLMMDMVRRQAAVLGNTPFMNLTLEEHTAEAGIITRIEAFIDMIQRRKRRTVCA